MKVGDLVKFKVEDHGEHRSPGRGLVVELVNPTNSITYEVYVLWDFLNGDIGRNWSYQLEVINGD